MKIDGTGRIEFFDHVGRKTHQHGRVIGDKVELNYTFEGLAARGTGRITAPDTMQGTETLDFLGTRKTIEWRLTKTQQSQRK